MTGNPYLDSCLFHLKTVCSNIDSVVVNDSDDDDDNDDNDDADEVVKKRVKRLDTFEEIQKKVNKFFYTKRNEGKGIQPMLAALSGYPNEKVQREKGGLPTPKSAITCYIDSIKDSLPDIALIERDEKSRFSGIKVLRDCKKDELIGIYTGAVRGTSDQDSSLYSLETQYQKDRDQPIQICIDAFDVSNKGKELNAGSYDTVQGSKHSHINMMCFVNHACPGADNLTISMHPLTASSRNHTYTLHVPTLISKRDIIKGEELFFDYGANYCSNDPNAILAEGYKTATECLCPLHQLEEYKLKYPWFLPVADGVTKKTKRALATLKEIKASTHAQHDAMEKDAGKWMQTLQFIHQHH